MRSPRFPLLLVPALLALALALAVAGCGGGGGGTTAITAEPEEKAEAKASLTKAEFIRQGNDICGEVNSAVGSASETEGQTTQVAGLYTGMVEGLQQLGRPAEAEGYGEFMEAGEVLAKVEGEVKLASEREDGEALETASQDAVPALEGFQSQAAIYGFADCSEGPHAVEATAPETGTAEPTEEVEETGGIEEAAPEEEFEEAAPEEEFIPEEEVEEVAPETGGAGGEIEEAAPEEAAPEEESGESGGVGPG